MNSTLLPIDRQRRILELVAQHGSVRTTRVAKILDVTEETVRRDFEKLVQDGHVLRAHGGVARVDADQRDLPLSRREEEQIAEKQVIAGLALPYIKPGDTILFDASTTVLELAKRLVDMRLTVITSALKIAVELENRPSMKVILTGGELSPSSLSCQGELAAKAIEYYNVQKAFISCRGIDVARGLSEANEEQARLKGRMLSAAEHIYLLADHSKFGLKSSYFFGSLEEINTLITDSQPDTATCELLKKANADLMHPASTQE